MRAEQPKSSRDPLAYSRSRWHDLPHAIYRLGVFSSVRRGYEPAPGCRCTGRRPQTVREYVRLSREGTVKPAFRCCRGPKSEADTVGTLLGTSVGPHVMREVERLALRGTYCTATSRSRAGGDLLKCVSATYWGQVGFPFSTLLRTEMIYPDSYLAGQIVLNGGAVLHRSRSVR